MTDQPPYDIATMLAVAGDVLDAVDPANDETERVAAAERAAKREPELALWVATQMLHGIVAQAGPLAAETMRRLRARFAEMPEF